VSLLSFLQFGGGGELPSAGSVDALPPARAGGGLLGLFVVEVKQLLARAYAESARTGPVGGEDPPTPVVDPTTDTTPAVGRPGAGNDLSGGGGVPADVAPAGPTAETDRQPLLNWNLVALALSLGGFIGLTVRRFFRPRQAKGPRTGKLGNL
jgi:hypothetical protein